MAFELSLKDLATTIKKACANSVKAIAIDGRGGSGKSTLATNLHSNLPDAQIVRMDDFYLPKKHRPNTPTILGSNFDRQRLIREVLKPHKLGQDTQYQRYDWGRDEMAEWHDVSPDTLLIVEGVYSLSNILRNYDSYGVFVHCSSDVCLARGIERDGEGMRETWTKLWMPAEENYIKAERPDKAANIIVSGEGDKLLSNQNNITIDMLTSFNEHG